MADPFGDGCGWHVHTFIIGMLLIGTTTSRAGEVPCNGMNFAVPDGFAVELVAGPPAVRWPISADFDEAGRLYVTESGGTGETAEKQLITRPNRVVRLEAATSAGAFDRRLVVADGMAFPEGALWRDGALFVAAPPSIWKLPVGEAGPAGERVEWFAGKTLTHCANDLHGPYQGPDGWIYWCKGAFAEQTYERPGRKPLVTKASHLFRARPDGTGIETVMTGGMDNPVGLAFTAGGEPIVCGTFLQHPAGGRRDGLIHAVYGGVYGKTNDVLDGHPRTGPDLMPVLSHLGPAAPCSVIRYESGVFGAPYRDNFFTALFNLHKVTRHVLTPAGATFASADQDFLVCDNVEFHPTHVLEDADGSLIVVDTGGWYHLCCPTSKLENAAAPGAIYRVRRVDAPRGEDPRGMRMPWATMGAEELAGHLNDRPAVRKRAIEALVAKGPAGVAAVAKVLRESADPVVRLAAVWAATRCDGPEARLAVRTALRDSDDTVRQAAIHSAGLWRDREALPTLVTMLAGGPAGGGSLQNLRAAAEAVGRLGDSAAVATIFAAPKGSGGRVLEHSLVYALIEIGDARAVAGGRGSEDATARRMAMIALDQMGSGELPAPVVVHALVAPDAATREAAAWIAGHHPEWVDALAAALADHTGPARLTEAERLGVLQQLASLSKSPAIQKVLAARLTDHATSAGERRAVLAAMRSSGVKEVPAAWVDGLITTLAADDMAIAAEAVKTVRRLPPSKANPGMFRDALLAIAGRADVPAETRLDALSAVAGKFEAMDAATFSFVSAQLAAGRPAAIRQAAADLLTRTKLSGERQDAVMAAVRDASPLEIDRLLAVFDDGGDDATGQRLIAAIKGAASFRSLRPEGLRRHLSHFGPAVAKQADELAAQLNPDGTKQQAHLRELLASLPAGDVPRGRAVFHSAQASCAACHAIGYVGGNVGPDLTSIGKIRSESDLLESIVYPSATFVQGFEPVAVDTRDGEHLSGILRGGGEDEMVIVTGPTQEVRVRRENVKQVRPGAVSVMPDGFEQVLTPQALADVVAFLKACR